MSPHGLMWWLMPVAAGQSALPFAVVIGIDDDDRLLRPHLDDELARPPGLFGRQAQIRVRVRAHRPIDVEPGVHHAHFDEPVDPLIGQQVVDVGSAQAGADAREELVVQAVLRCLASSSPSTPARPRRSSLTISVPSTLMSGVTLPSLPQSLGLFVGDEVAVGEDLEVAVRVRFEHVEQLADA